MRTAILIAAHGSHLDAHSSDPVHAHAEVLRKTGAFDEVLLGFWKEEPALSRSLDGTSAAIVAVVPFFMAHGYFTQTVLPAELGLAADQAPNWPGKRIVMGRALGTLPHLADAVEARAREGGAGPEDTLVVLGHGTPRSGESATAAAVHAQALAARGEFGRVVARYLDQEPSLEQLPAPEPGARTVVVPLFVSEGWHVGTSIPELLDGLGRNDVTITGSVGTHPSIAGLLAEIARDALADVVTA